MSAPLPVEKYYSRLETKLGFRMLLGGASHHAYYRKSTTSPFPLSEGLRAMEDRLMLKLGARPGDKVMDAGCGTGVVAMHLAEYGIRVTGIDILPEHIAKANEYAEAANVRDTVRFVRGDIQQIGTEADSFDGVFAMEVLSQVVDVPVALQEMYRVLKPGRKIAIFDIEHKKLEDMDDAVARSAYVVKRAIGGHWADFGSYKTWLEEVGFVDVQIEDLSENIAPMGRLFRALSAVPYAIIQPLGLSKHFPNMYAGHNMYSNAARKNWKYLAISAKKPLAEDEKPRKENPFTDKFAIN
ncbi:hypothetical protein ANO11243_083860 [Dothideomycetidae sp. 11243]|nr:hypothetical protein ANO11243_083860 [fungal sp. No.11243]